MTRLRWFLVWLALIGGLAVWATGRLTRDGVVRTDVLALLPKETQDGGAEAAMAHLARAGGNRAFLLVVDRDTPGANRATATVAESLTDSRAFAGVRARVPRPGIKGVMDFFRQAGPSLAPADPPDLRQTFVARGYGAFSTTGTLGLRDDPFGYASAWMKGMPWPQADLQWNDGYLNAPVAEGVATLVILELRADAQQYHVQVAAARAVDDAERVLRDRHPTARLRRLGGVFYAEAAQTGAREDTDRIGLGSALGVVLLMLLVFRSLSMLATGFISILVGVVVGTGAVLAVFGEIHLITVVFGVSLIGEVSDYSIQLISARLSDEADGRTDWLHRVTPGLLMALGTSLLGYAAMTLVPLPSIRQIAVFALTGLSAAFLTVMLAGPLAGDWLRGGRVSDVFARLARLIRAGSARLGRGSLALAIAGLGLGLFLVSRVRTDDDVRNLIHRPERLVADEAAVKRALGADFSTQFILIKPDEGTDEACLRAEESLRPTLEECRRLGLLSGWTALAEVIPSAQRQTASVQAYRAALGKERSRLEEAFEELGFTPPPGFWDAAPGTIDLPSFLALPEATPFRHLRFAHEGKILHVVTLRDVKDDAGLRAKLGDLREATLVDKTWSISRLLGEVRRQGVGWMALACLLALAILSQRYGIGRSLLLLLPTLLGVVWAPVLAGACGVPFSVFGLMALMLVLGVGVNYSIFLWEGGDRSKSALAGVVAACLTTLLSFGLLAVCALPALRWLGLTLSFGILTAFVLTPLSLLGREPREET